MSKVKWLFIFLFILTGCFEKKQKETIVSERSSSRSIYSFQLKEEICGCYAQYGFFNRLQFEEYINNIEAWKFGTEPHPDSLKNYDYGFLLYEDSLYLMDFNLTKVLSFEEAKAKAIKIHAEDCSKDKYFFKKVLPDISRMIESEIKADREIRKQFKKELIQVAGKYIDSTLFAGYGIEEEKMYVPKNGVERKKRTLIEFVKLDKHWLAKTESKSHSDENLNSIIENILNYTDTSSIIRDYRVVRFLVPLTFYEPYQVEDWVPQ